MSIPDVPDRPWKKEDSVRKRRAPAVRVGGTGAGAPEVAYRRSLEQPVRTAFAQLTIALRRRDRRCLRHGGPTTNKSGWLPSSGHSSAPQSLVRQSCAFGEIPPSPDRNTFTRHGLFSPKTVDQLSIPEHFRPAQFQFVSVVAVPYPSRRAGR